MFERVFTRGRRCICAFVVYIMCATLTTNLASAHELRVDGDHGHEVGGAIEPDGGSWDTAYKFLQDALTAASEDPAVTEIWVAKTEINGQSNISSVNPPKESGRG